ncbi:MAG: phenylacetate-CoA oxygenase subunit PaaI [Thermogemmatispora sp.]|uniref:Phenylacetic acid catabolic protein n=1 Tax=Thermogemmatispora sp. TaxID=1968838 RepID=UPI0019D8037C|nr:Phenylacetic acid catabolic protein [Thermogemmatispora sp.]MBE3566792.1 phenylacetate-CoA oxygenase subunit PaaI [Thermogemmatispora sp.]
MSTASDEELTPAVVRLVATLVAAKRRLARHYLEWCVRGPILEASTAVSAMAQEEYGQARVLAGLLDEEGLQTGLSLPAAVLQPAPCWISLICLAALFDTAVTEALAAAARCSPSLARRVAKILQEESFHQLFAQQWLQLLGQEAALRPRLLQQVEQLRAPLLPWVEQLDQLLSETAVAHGQSAQAAAAWQQRITDWLRQLAPGDDAPRPHVLPGGSS